MPHHPNHGAAADSPARPSSSPGTLRLARIVALLTAVAMPFCGYAIYLNLPYLTGLAIVVALALVGLSLSLALLILADMAQRGA
ncbi:hypothetical protein F1188_08640 [Roseospira marina]|uniref:Uncharacterized protein n=1 Tax=Roseospira marina TaxID=140057 RepID=A0A5M6ICV2_9PROT|nr:hypothetical protein [Roseospira marina]KAA5606066.1 hypothetical protein F1188_08640 [Roseospira marina]MBB4313070.1 hypothetical protein [Roseospira marina]MBB5086189.1 hypothetical protein [Roseospira marina]